MSKDREKELKKLIYLKSEIIKECKRDIKKYHEEINQINGYKKLEKIEGSDSNENRGNNKFMEQI